MVNRHMCFRRLGHFLAGVLGVFYFGVDRTHETRGKISNSIELRPEEVPNCCVIWYWEDHTVV